MIKVPFWLKQRQFGCCELRGHRGQTHSQASTLLHSHTLILYYLLSALNAHKHIQWRLFLLCSLLLPAAMFPGLDEAELMLPGWQHTS